MDHFPYRNGMILSILNLYHGFVFGLFPQKISYELNVIISTYTHSSKNMYKELIRDVSPQHATLMHLSCHIPYLIGGEVSLYFISIGLS